MSDTKRKNVPAKESMQAAGSAKERKGTVKGSATGSVAYLGPSIRGVVRTNTVFNNGLPDALDAMVKEMPVLGALVVPVGELAVKRKELQDGTSAMGVCYRKAVSALEK